MSNQGWNTKQTTPKLDRIELTSTVKLYIPDDVKNKIQFLCKKIAKDEWSGILFYDIEGDINNVAKMKITLKDILLMDKGNSVYTSFDWNEDVVAYQMDNPEAMNYWIGHIHSHNTMRVFFSGTDWDELNDNCTQHNFYLSVIVNNYTDVVAKIAFTGKSQNFVCKNKNGKDYNLKITNSTAEPTMLVYDCDIHINDVEITVPDTFSQRVNTIQEQAEIKAKEEAASKEKSKTVVNNPAVKTGWEVDLRNNRSTKGIHGQAQQEFFKELRQEMSEEDAIDLSEAFTKMTIEQEFATYVLRLGNNEAEIDDELIDALEDIEESKTDIPLLSKSIVETYGPLYDRFFEKLPKYQGDDAFIQVLDDVIIALEEEEKDYGFLAIIISDLKEMGNRFENFLKQNNYEPTAQ